MQVCFDLCLLGFVIALMLAVVDGALVWEQQVCITYIKRRNFVNDEIKTAVYSCLIERKYP